MAGGVSYSGTVAGALEAGVLGHQAIAVARDAGGGPWHLEPAAAVAFAGLFKLIHQGVIKPEQSGVINCTGHTFPGPVSYTHLTLPTGDLV